MSDLSKEEMNQAIARACGFCCHEQGFRWRTICDRCGPELVCKKCGESAGEKRQVPNYSGDLNAMHEAEKWLRGTLEQYRNDPVFYRRWQVYINLLERNVHAEAFTKARAFLATIAQYTK